MKFQEILYINQELLISMCKLYTLLRDRYQYMAIIHVGDGALKAVFEYQMPRNVSQ